MSDADLILAIETSNPSSGPRGRNDRGRVIGPGVALARVHDEFDILADEPLAETSRHDDDLMPSIARLFDRAGANPGDLATVAVSVGPGGYTAVRIAIATAKLIAHATGAGTVAVPSAIAAGLCVVADRPSLICLASKNDRTHATLLPVSGTWGEQVDAVKTMATTHDFARTTEQIRSEKWWTSAACPLGVIGIEQLASLAPGRLVADRFLPDSIRFWAEEWDVEVVEPVFSPTFVLRIAYGELPEDPAMLGPIYPREPDAVRQWRLRTSGK